jgi:hypothetical protein
MHLGYALAQRGTLTQARDLLIDAVAYFKAHEDRRLEGSARAALAEAHVLAGDLEAAERQAALAKEALALFPPLRVSASAVLAEVRLARGEADAALRLAREAVGLLDTLNDSTQRTRVGAGAGARANAHEPLARLVYARALHAAGDEAGARMAIGRARDRLLARAQLIGDAGWRASFLQNVAANARTLELAGEWLEG